MGRWWLLWQWWRYISRQNWGYWEEKKTENGESRKDKQQSGNIWFSGNDAVSKKNVEVIWCTFIGIHFAFFENGKLWFLNGQSTVI